MIIAITGKSGSGKDTVANLLDLEICKTISKTLDIYQSVKFKHNHYKKVKFADKVTEAFEIITGVNFHKVSRERKEELRSLYSEFAESQKGIFGKNVWVTGLFSTYTKAKLFIITDLRFHNEIKEIKKVPNNIVIEVDRRKYFSEWCKDYKLEYYNPDTITGLYTEYEFALELEQLDSTKSILISEIIRKTCKLSETELEFFQEKDVNYNIKNYSSLNELQQQVQNLYIKEIENKIIEFLNYGKRKDFWEL
jgi:hypothetical protein